VQILKFIVFGGPRSEHQPVGYPEIEAKPCIGGPVDPEQVMIVFDQAEAVVYLQFYAALQGVATVWLSISVPVPKVNLTGFDFSAG